VTPSEGIIGEGAAVATSFVRYRGAILPRVHRELAGWRRAAKAIPDPVLREQAVTALDEKADNVEATAVFASLAPRRTRPTVIRASTALQVAVDYLDTLGEQPGPDPLRDGLLLHGALAAALEPGAASRDWYAHHPQREDGGYLDRLVTACREAATSLPAAAAILPLARRAIVRCGEGQSRTHATAEGSARELQRWASELSAPAGFEWWEVAAGASSSVAAHALLALAADPEATPGQGELVDAAYFPSIGALTVLLDDLVDREADEAAGEHSYLRHFSSDAEAAARLETIAGLADRSVSPLPRSGRHRAILSGVLALYLSSPGAAAPGARAIRDRLLASSGPTVRALAGVLRRKRPGPAGNRPGL
jgi:tetraprenyl-beta-curcumene synthase